MVAIGFMPYFFGRFFDLAGLATFTRFRMNSALVGIGISWPCDVFCLGSLDSVIFKFPPNIF